MTSVRTIFLSAAALSAAALIGTAASGASPAPTASIPVKGLVSGFAAGADSVWAAEDQSTTLLRIDPRTNRVVARIPFGKPLPFVDDPTQDQVDDWVTVADGFVWATDQYHGRVVRISPGTHRVVAATRVASPWDVAVADGSIWIPQFEPYAVARIDEQTGKVTKRFPAVGPTSASSGAGAVWVLEHRGYQLLRIDTKTNATVEIPLTGAQAPDACRFLLGYAWCSDRSGLIFRIDPHGNRLKQIHLKGGWWRWGESLLTDGHRIIVASAMGAYATIDPATGKVLGQVDLNPHPGHCGPATETYCFFTGALVSDGTLWEYDPHVHAIVRYRL